MFDLGHFFNGIVGLVDGILNLYMWVIIIRAFVSWIRPDPYNPIVQFLYRVTDPFLNVIRRYLPQSLWSTGIDFSPLVGILLIVVVRLFITSIRL